MKRKNVFSENFLENILIIIAVIAVGLVIVFTIAGCDEGLNMAGDVMGGEPEEVVDTKPDDPAETDAETPPKEVDELGQVEEQEGGEPAEQEESENDVPDAITTIGEMKSDPMDDNGEPADQESDKPTETAAPAEVIEISYYLDADLTISIHEPPYFDRVLYEPGIEIYIKVVFSGKVPFVVGGPGIAKPQIRYTFSGIWPNDRNYYRIRVRDTAISQLNSGDAKPLSDTTFVCKYVVSKMGASYGGGGISTLVQQPTLFHRVIDISRRGTYFSITDPPQITDLLAGSDASHPAPASEPADFVGRVGVPFSLTEENTYIHPVSGVTVSIIDGTRAGEQVTTDPGGWYHFKDLDPRVFELHLRVEKEHFEPREVIVSRQWETKVRTPKSGIDVSSNYPDLPENQPGVIMIGQEWPKEVRFIFEEMLLPEPLLLYVDDRTAFPYMPGGLYGDGKIYLYDHRNPYGENYGTDMSTNGILHECFHAHQHAMEVLEFGEYDQVRSWEETPEGRAYAGAQAADWRQFGKTHSDIAVEIRHTGSRARLSEASAEIVSAYFGIEYLGGISYLPTRAPNRLRWVQEWIHNNP